MNQHALREDILRVANNINPDHKYTIGENPTLKTLLLAAESIERMAITFCEQSPGEESTKNRDEIDVILKNLKTLIKTQNSSNPLTHPKEPTKQIEGTKMKTIKLPKPQETTLSVIASQGIESAISRRLNGGGYNKVLIVTKEATYLIDPWETHIVEMVDTDIAIIKETHETVINAADMFFFNRIESSIHEREEENRVLGFTVAKGRPKQIKTLDKAQADNHRRILKSLAREVRNPRNPISKVYGDGHIDTLDRNKLTILVDEKIDGKTIEYKYTYNLITREFTKEIL